MLDWLSEMFSRIPALLRSVIVITLALFVAALDSLTPGYISFIGYYLIPLFLSIWYFSRSSTFVLVFAIVLLSRLYVVERAVPVSKPFWEFALTFGSPLISFTFFSFLVINLKRYVHNIAENGDKDELTGLRNRRSFFALGKYELMRRNRVRYPLTVAMMDIDCFKTLNDTQGHDAGDKLLIAFSECLISSLRHIDIIARIGGDEFALMLPNTNFEQTKLVLGRLHTHLQPVLKSFGCDDLGCSVGAVNVKAETPDGEINDLLKRADTLMYKVKNNNKNHILVEEI